MEFSNESRRDSSQSGIFFRFRLEEAFTSTSKKARILNLSFVELAYDEFLPAPRVPQ
jgi:hypothetical protein